MSGKGEEYECEHCGGVFNKGWSDKEAMAETNEIFSEEEIEHGGLSILCDDCHKKFMEWFTSLTKEYKVEALKEMQKYKEN